MNLVATRHTSQKSTHGMIFSNVCHNVCVPVRCCMVCWPLVWVNDHIWLTWNKVIWEVIPWILTIILLVVRSPWGRYNVWCVPQLDLDQNFTTPARLRCFQPLGCGGRPSASGDEAIPQNPGISHSYSSYFIMFRNLSYFRHTCGFPKSWGIAKSPQALILIIHWSNSGWFRVPR